MSAAPVRSGTADLALMGGGIPPWLFERMTRLGLHVTEAVVADYGTAGFLSRVSDPFWFQSFASVIGMDWNSSGATTAVLRALKRALNPRAADLGLFVAGGKGNESRRTPDELARYGDRTGVDADALARASRLSAKVDSAAVQDGHTVYIHAFVVSADGAWSVVQQGMDAERGTARRYHWHSEAVQSFVSDPHAAICGRPGDDLLNLVDGAADPTRTAMLDLTAERPAAVLKEAADMRLPTHHGVRKGDVDLTRLGAALHLAHERGVDDFEELLLLRGVGARTLQSLALVSEVVHGAPTRFRDPARFAFAHGGKGGTPFPVPTTVYDETIETLRSAVERAKLGETDKAKALRSLHRIATRLEEGFTPGDFFDATVARERAESWRHGGRTASGWAAPPGTEADVSEDNGPEAGDQLGLFGG
ncbi:MAG: DUF763 domain-containing protein [Bacteroidota bacterium]